MRKSLLSLAVLSALSIPTAVFAEEAAAPAAAAPAPAYTISYNVGLYSQYVFRGLTQTSEKPAIQGGVDYSHASGFYAGAWASNVSWLEDGGYYDSSSLELDLYGGFRNTIGESGLGYDVGVLQYIYPGNRISVAGAAKAETTEIYGALSYKWLQAKVSYVVSKDAFGNEDGQGTYYAELNANIPVADTGITANLHIGRQEYDGQNVLGSNDDNYTYTDWKIGATKSWANGVNLGAYYTDVDAKNKLGYAAYAGGPIDDSTFTVFVQKTF
jgi:uncharacterized protein (TIGR02001 family)